MKSAARRKSGARTKHQRKRTASKPAAEESQPVHLESTLNVVDFPELPALVQYVRQGRCTLFVGAGLSKGAGLPTWRELMQRLIPASTPFAVSAESLAGLERFVRPPYNDADMKRLKRLFIKALGRSRFQQLLNASADDRVGFHPRDVGRKFQRVKRDTAIALELGKLMDAGKLPELAGYCRNLLGRERFHEQVRSELRSKPDIPETHHAIVRTPWASIVTTNFDDLLEGAYARWDRRGIPKAPTGAELPQQGTLLLDGTFFILKAHGDIDDEASIIFTSEDYRRVVHSNPAFQAMLTGILLSRAVLFVGYSLSDVNFRLLLDNQLTIFNEFVPPRYALMEGVGAAEREILWRTAKLRVFSYPKDQHDVVRRFLSTLADRSQTSEATETQEEKSGVPRPRPTLNRPPDIPLVMFACRASGDRITLDLYDETPGRSRRRVWSGGCQWPEWPKLKQSMAAICTSTHGKLAEANATGAMLQRVMPHELLQHLEALAPDTPVALALSAETETLPWEWMIVEGSPLCLRNPVIRRPVGISDKARGLRFVGTPLRALIVADAGVGDMGKSSSALPGSAKEARAIAALIRNADSNNFVQVLEREQAVYARLVSEVESGDYDIIHFAGHAWFEQSQALLYLWDGRVTSSELSSLLNRRPPALFVLNSHYTAFVPPGIAGDEDRWNPETSAPGVDRPAPAPFGFTGPASRSGVDAFVGCFSGGLADEPAALFAQVLYQELLTGAHFASALHSARKATTRFDDITGLLYTGTGYPGLRLIPVRTSMIAV